MKPLLRRNALAQLFPNSALQMKLHLALTDGLAMFSGYGDGYVAVNGKHHTANVAVLPNRVFAGWTTATFETLSETDFEFIARQEVDIALLGTGQTLRFPPSALLRPLAGTRCGLEVMDTAAACRTYNILAAEGRKVGAFLLLG